MSNRNKTIYYRGYAHSEAEAEDLAKRLLTEYAAASGLEGQYHAYKLTEWNGNLSTLALILHGDERRSEDTPAVYIMRTTPKGGDTVYWLYLLFDRDRLPFYVKHVADLHFFLPAFQITVRPEAPLPVEALLTYEGARDLDEAIEGGYLNEKDSERTADRDIRRAKEAPEGLRIYSLFTDFGELSLNEIKDALEAGEYDGTTVDVETTLSALTGKTFKTEKEYLSAVADFAGKDETERYKEDLLSGFRFCRSFRFVEYLEYELLRTEDYGYVQQHYAEYASALGYKEEYIDALLRKGKEGTSTALETALYKYLQHYAQLRTVYEGLSEDRIADYLNAPKEAIRKVTAVTQENTIL